MKTFVDKLMAPTVTVGSTTIAASRVIVEENPLGPVSLEIDFPASGLAKTPRPGDAVNLNFGGCAIEGHVRTHHRVRTTVGETVTLAAVLRNEAWRPITVHFRQKKRAFCLRALLREMALRENGGPTGDEEHGWLTLLSEPPWYVSARLALLGGQLLLNTATGAVLARPDQPGTAKPLPANAFFTVDEHSVPGLSLVAPAPKAWGKVLTREWESSGPEADHLVLHLGEANSVAELTAVGTVLRAVEAMGNFVALSGRELLGIAPGDWIAHPSGAKYLVTSRSCSWTQGTGWRVELRGGYPWRGMIHDAVPQPETAEVVGFDEVSGRLNVRLPWHKNIEIAVFLRTDRGGVKSYKLTVPSVGEFGMVQFTHGPDHAMYLGAAPPDQVLTQKDFENTVDILRTEGSMERRCKDGSVEFVWSSFKAVCKGMMEYVAEKFYFKKG